MRLLEIEGFWELIRHWKLEIEGFWELIRHWKLIRLIHKLSKMRLLEIEGGF
jgi:hypothetical protein